MEFRILGPLQVLRDGVPLVLGGTLQRSVLARLLLDAGRVVRAETLIDDVWAGRPPPTAGKTLQKYISGLRKIIGRSTLRTVAGGYAVDVAGDVLDSRRFEECVAAGAFADAIALWRGDVLADLPECGFAMPERRRLEDLYLVAVEGRMRDELAGGRHAEAVGDLEVLVAAHPLRERLVAMHMLALYRSGRPVEAVRAYERHRRRLAEDVGMVPASELRELEAAMLRQDPALELDVAPPAARNSDGVRGRPCPVLAGFRSRRFRGRSPRESRRRGCGTDESTGSRRSQPGRRIGPAVEGDPHELAEDRLAGGVDRRPPRAAREGEGPHPPARPAQHRASRAPDGRGHKALRVRGSGRHAVAARPVRGPAAADRVPLHVPPRVGRRVPQLQRRHRRAVARLHRAPQHPRHHLRPRVPRPPGQTRAVEDQARAGRSRGTPPTTATSATTSAPPSTRHAATTSTTTAPSTSTPVWATRA